MDKINWYGAYTLCLRETKRFLRVYNQTLISPAVSALIFLAVFVLAIGTNHHEINGIKFVNFMGYGLIIMSIVQNAYANSSSSFIMSKMLGYISDILTPPLGGVEIIIAFNIGSILRGLMVGIITTITLLPFIDFNVYHPELLVFFVIASCSFLGLLGILSGLLASSFDQLAAMTSYLITPLSFLSGTFYSVSHLPVFLQVANYVNPFFYMIDGFRYCLTDKADSNISTGIIILLAANIMLFFILKHLISKGWRIKG